MSLLLMAGKFCQMCSESKFSAIRRGYIKDFSGACDKAVEDEGLKYSDGEIEYNQLTAMEDLVSQLRLLCLRCTGKNAEAFLVIDKTIAAKVEEDIKQAEQDLADQEEKALEHMGVKKEGNLYQVKFGKR